MMSHLVVVTAGVGAAGGQAHGDVTVAGARLTGRALPRCRRLERNGRETSNTQETLQMQEETNQILTKEIRHTGTRDLRADQRSHQRSNSRPEMKAQPRDQRADQRSHQRSKSRPEITSEIKDQTKDQSAAQRSKSRPEIKEQTRDHIRDQRAA